MGFPTSGGNHYPPFRRLMVFVDGENLVSRYQAMVKSEHIPVKGCPHLRDVYVWLPTTIVTTAHEIMRATYYTSVRGDDDKMKEVRNSIKRLGFQQPTFSGLPSNLSPWVGKRTSNDERSKGVDIRMAVDILTHCHSDNLDTVYLVTGDGDFLPVIKEALRSGKQVHLAALASGLNEKMLDYVDKFVNLDPIYFPT